MSHLYIFLKYIHLTQCIHHNGYVDTINKVYMCTLYIQMYISAQNVFYICTGTFVIFCYTSTLHSFPWTTIPECIHVLDVSECTISFLMSHLYIFFLNTSTLHNVSIIVYMWTLSIKCTYVHDVSKCTLMLNISHLHHFTYTWYTS